MLRKHPLFRLLVQVKTDQVIASLTICCKSANKTRKIAEKQDGRREMGESSAKGAGLLPS